MPGLEKRLARYPQLYSSVGCVHQFRALSSLELPFIVQPQLPPLGLTLSLSQITREVVRAARESLVIGPTYLFEVPQSAEESAPHILEDDNRDSMASPVL